MARNERSRLDARQHAALELADAFVTDPARIDGDLRGRVLEHLSASEIVELMFDVIAWSQQKVLVALSLDAPLDPEALTPLDFDAAGHALVGDTSHERQM